MILPLPAAAKGAKNMIHSIVILQRAIENNNIVFLFVIDRVWEPEKRIQNLIMNDVFTCPD